MSRYIATHAIRGAHNIVHEADELLQQALAEKGPGMPAAFPNTAYHLPLVLGMTGREVDTLGDLTPVIDQAKRLLHPAPPGGPFDVVFLRNVLIYFDAATKRDILARMRRVMRPGGFLVLGAAESMVGIDADWERVPTVQGSVYRLPGGTS